MSAAPELYQLTFSDWEGTRRAHLDAVPGTATVGQAVAEAARALDLPFGSFFKALHRGRELNHGDSIGEVGLRERDDLDLIPEVSAG